MLFLKRNNYGYLAHTYSKHYKNVVYPDIKRPLLMLGTTCHNSKKKQITFTLDLL